MNNTVCVFLLVPCVSEEFRQQLEFVAERVNVQKWRKLVRILGVTDADIDDIVERYKSSVREQILSALLLWASRNAGQPCRVALTDALQRSQLKLISDQLDDSFPSLVNR